MEEREDLRLINCLILSQPTTKEKLSQKQRALSQKHERFLILIGSNPNLPSADDIDKTRKMMQDRANKLKEKKEGDG